MFCDPGLGFLLVTRVCYFIAPKQGWSLLGDKEIKQVLEMLPRKRVLIQNKMSALIQPPKKLTIHMIFTCIYRDICVQMWAYQSIYQDVWSKSKHALVSISIYIYIYVQSSVPNPCPPMVMVQPQSCPPPRGVGTWVLCMEYIVNIKRVGYIYIYIYSA